MALLAGPACGEPKVSSTEDAKTKESAVSAAPAGTLPTGSGAASAAVPLAAASCTADADCRTWSSYCRDAPCTCRAIGKSDPDPVCSSPGDVNCFVDPCMKKAAACQGGKCELVIAPPK